MGCWDPFPDPIPLEQEARITVALSKSVLQAISSQEVGTVLPAAVLRKLVRGPAQAGAARKLSLPTGCLGERIKEYSEGANT